jgi:hypothetical protein
MTTTGKAESLKSLRLDELGQARTTVLTALNSLPPDSRREPFLGIWSSYELVAHLIGWDYTNIQAIADIQAGQLPQFYAHRDRDWQTYNAHLVREYSKESWEELMAAVADSYLCLVTVLRSLPADEFYKDRGIRFRGWKVMISVLVEADIKDVTTHAAQVAAFKQQGLPSGSHVY